MGRGHYPGDPVRKLLREWLQDLIDKFEVLKCILMPGLMYDAHRFGCVTEAAFYFALPLNPEWKVVVSDDSFFAESEAKNS